MAIPAIPAIPVSLAENESISLPLERRPCHIHITIPFSLLVKDFDPNTAQVPQLELPRSWWWPTRLFGRRYETLTDATTKAVTIAHPTYRQVWPKLSALLFGKEETTLYSVLGSDAKDWERAGASNIFWAFSTGVTDDDIVHARAIVLKASPCGTGGILFTVEEMGERDKVAWKTAWMDVVLYKSAGESDVDLAMARKNHALYRHMAGWAPRPSNKESFESD
ncbi:hypothetical protein C8A00DRAFT_16513 [Chaetomidium leptoderma]|uniref:Uncharacterized protein n=1 Tax=Chaetomidium leptoderma TaxID=669021 RepID=A0AAN6ZVZ0_9PEZI|nr:hypothetical protein C8A00DRAFT_16513 [Chaetomidium leptoderma]